MISTLDHLIIAVKDLEEAEKNYKKIFGADPVWRGEHKALGTINSIFNFKNTYFELLAAKGSGRIMSTRELGGRLRKTGLYYTVDFFTTESTALLHSR